MNMWVKCVYLIEFFFLQNDADNILLYATE